MKKIHKQFNFKTVILSFGGNFLAMNYIFCIHVFIFVIEVFLYQQSFLFPDSNRPLLLENQWNKYQEIQDLEHVLPDYDNFIRLKAFKILENINSFASLKMENVVC